MQEWRRGLGFGSLRARIFAVNIVAVIVLAIMLLYLDTVRSRLLDERTDALVEHRRGDRRAGQRVAAGAGAERQLSIAARGCGCMPPMARCWSTIGALPRQSASSSMIRPRYSWRRASAKFIDRALERLVRFQALPPYDEVRPDTAGQWPEITAADATGRPATALRRADDGSFIIAAAARLCRAAARCI